MSNGQSRPGLWSARIEAGSGAWHHKIINTTSTRGENDRWKDDALLLLRLSGKVDKAPPARLSRNDAVG
jgi:hypothetical protein